MSALEKYLDTTPKEFGGPNALNGFDYQIKWTLLKILDEHLTESNCYFVIEHHDDLLRINTDMNTIDFYQIKSGKEISISDIIRKDKKSNSIITKLLFKELKTQDLNSSYNLVSEMIFKFCNTKSNLICYTSLTKADKRKINKALKDAISKPKDTFDYSFHLNNLYFIWGPKSAELEDSIVSKILRIIDGKKHKAYASDVYLINNFLTLEIFNKGRDKGNHKRKTIKQTDINAVFEKFNAKAKIYDTLDHLCKKYLSDEELVEYSIKIGEFTRNKSNGIEDEFYNIIRFKVKEMKSKKSGLKDIIDKIVNDMAAKMPFNDLILLKINIIWVFCEQ